MLQMNLQYFGGRGSAGGNTKASATRAAEPKEAEMKEIDQNEKMLQDVGKLPEETFILRYFDKIMGRFGNDVVLNKDSNKWEIASENYNQKDLANMFVRSFKDIYGSDAKLSVSEYKSTQVIDLDLGNDTGVLISIYPNPNASIRNKRQKGYSASISYHEPNE